MKLTTLSIGVSRTFNMGDYNSLKVEASVTASVEDEAEIPGAREALLAEVRTSLQVAYAAFKPKAKPT